MRILILSAFFPSRRHGGGFGLFNTIRALSKKCEISLLCYTHTVDDGWQDYPLNGNIADIINGRQRFLDDVRLLFSCCKKIEMVPISQTIHRPSSIQSSQMNNAFHHLKLGVRLAISSLLPTFIKKSLAYSDRSSQSPVASPPSKRLPSSVVSYYSHAMQKLLSEALHSSHYDLVCIEFPNMGIFVEDLPAKMPRVFSTHEDFRENLKRISETAKNPDKKKLYHDRYRAYNRYLKRICPQFDAIIAFSEKDRLSLSKLSKSPEKVHYVPWRIISDEMHYKEPLKQSNNIVYLAYYGNTSNVDAVLWFCREVWPLIRTQFPSVTFDVLGSNPSAEMMEFNGKDGISVYGFIENPWAVIQNAAVFVVPMRQGGGVKGKIIQAMAVGTAVVSTTTGAEGVEARHGEHLLMADDPKEFAQSVISLIKSYENRLRLSHNARKLVAGHYDVSASTNRLLSVYEKAIKRRHQFINSEVIIN